MKQKEVLVVLAIQVQTNIKMKYLASTFFFVLIVLLLAECRTTKRISKVVATKDTLAVAPVNTSYTDSIAFVKKTIDNFKKHYIDFKTFAAKIKVEYEDSKGKQPDVTAKVCVFKDSLIWISLTATFLNFEVFRAYINKDSVILINKQAKEVQYRSLDYLQEITQIPFDYSTLQDLLVGNPIFLDSNIVSFKKTENAYRIGIIGTYFKHLLTLSLDNNILLHSKLDDVDVTRNRTADITYSDFEKAGGIDFSTYREITVSEKNKLDIRMNYKSYEFNKDLSVSLSIPKNYTRN